MMHPTCNTHHRTVLIICPKCVSDFRSLSPPAIILVNFQVYDTRGNPVSDDYPCNENSCDHSICLVEVTRGLMT